MEEIKKPHLICIDDFGSDDDDDSGESGYVDGSSFPASIARVARPERSASVGSSSSLNDSNQGKPVLRYMNILQIGGAGQSGNADQMDGNMVLAAPLTMKQKLSCVKSELNKKSGMVLKTQNDLIQRNSEYTLLQTNMERAKSEIDLLRQKLAESEKKNRLFTSQVIDLTSGGVAVKQEQDSGLLSQISQLELELQRKDNQLENLTIEREELQEKVTKMESLLQKVEKGILDKIQRVQKPDAEIGLTPQGEVGPDLWRRICLCEQELIASKDKIESLKHKIQKKDQRLAESEKRVGEVQAELGGKDLNLQRTEASLKQLQARVKWYSEILHKKEEQLCKFQAEKKEQEVEKSQVKPAAEKDKSKLEFALNKPNIFDILKRQLSSVPAKRKKASAAVGSAAVAEMESAEKPQDSGDSSKDTSHSPLKVLETDVIEKREGSVCGTESDSKDIDSKAAASGSGAFDVAKSTAKLKISRRESVGDKSTSKIGMGIFESFTKDMDCSEPCTKVPESGENRSEVKNNLDPCETETKSKSSQNCGAELNRMQNLDISEPKTQVVDSAGKNSENNMVTFEKTANIKPMESGSSTGGDAIKSEVNICADNASLCTKEKQPLSLFQPFISNTRTVQNSFACNLPPSNLNPLPLIGSSNVPDYFGATSPIAAFSYSNFLQPSNVPTSSAPPQVLPTVSNQSADPTNGAFSCPTLEDLQNSSGFFGDLLLPSNCTNPEETSDISTLSRPPSFASFSEPTTGLSTPSIGELLVPNLNVVVKQEPLENNDLTLNPALIKEEPPDANDEIINSVLGLGKDKGLDEDPFEDSLLKSLIAAQSFPSTPNDMDFSDDSNGSFASPAFGKHVQNFLNGNDDETPAGPMEGSLDAGPTESSLEARPTASSLEARPTASSLEARPTASSLDPGPRVISLKATPTESSLDAGPTESSLDTVDGKKTPEESKVGQEKDKKESSRATEGAEAPEVLSESKEDSERDTSTNSDKKLEEKIELEKVLEDSEDELEEGEIRDTDDELEAGPSNVKAGEEKEFTWSADALKPVNRVECNVCGKMFLTEKLLSSHKRWHRQQNHCRECGKTFLWQFQLSLHQHEQHGIKEEGVGSSGGGDGDGAVGLGGEVEVEEDGGDESDIGPFMDEDSDLDSMEESITSGNYDLEDELTNSEFEAGKSDTGLDSVKQEEGSANADIGSIPCKICKKTFRTPNALSMHSSVHTGFSYICTICGKGYKLDMRYKQHLANAHGLLQLQTENSHSCDYCEKSYKTAIAKREHMLTAHPGKKNFKCNICYKSYHSFTKKQQHMIKSHPAWAPFMCQVCRATYNTSKALMQHIQEEHGSTAAQPVVPRKPASQRMLKRYMTEPLPCPPPVKQHVTSVQGPLKIVIKTIKPDPDDPQVNNNLPPFVKPAPEPEPVFVPRKSYSVIECDVCNLSFSFKASMKFHLMFAHPSATMHECKRCGMAYTVFRNLQAHKNIHNFNHRCYYCRKSFPKKSALQNHVKTHFPELKGLHLLLKSNRKRRVKPIKTEPLQPWW